jgi:hypothetical protein
LVDVDFFVVAAVVVVEEVVFLVLVVVVVSEVVVVVAVVLAVVVAVVVVAVVVVADEAEAVVLVAEHTRPTAPEPEGKVPCGHVVTHVPAAVRNVLLLHRVQRGPSRPQSQFAQFAGAGHTQSLLALSSPPMQEKGARHARPKAPTP